MISTHPDRSEAARRANETRRRRSELDVDLAALREHFTSAPKSEARDKTVAFLARFTRPGGTVGDLLGPGWSAEALHAAGLDVLAVDNLVWPKRFIPNASRARAAVEELAAQIGCRLHVGEFHDVIDQMASANYDACGPYHDGSPQQRDVLAMAKAGLDCFAVTVLWSRNPGMKERGPDQYDVLHRVLLRRDSTGYRIWDVITYPGKQNVTVGVYLLLRSDLQGRNRNTPLTRRKYNHWKCELVRIAVAERRASTVKTCRLCGSKFVPARKLDQQYCGECPPNKRRKTDEWRTSRRAWLRAERAAHRATVVRSCPTCGATFSPAKTLRQTFCSFGCRPSGKRQRIYVEKACQWCGASFDGSRTSNQIYCSESCQVARNRRVQWQRERARQATDPAYLIAKRAHDQALRFARRDEVNSRIRDRYASDPEYRARVNAANRASARRRKAGAA